MAPDDNFLEAAAADTAAGEVAHAAKHSLPIGTPCPNCATRLAGSWCYACGQRAEKYDRSILHLVAEAFEGLTHLDGRFWTTVPSLVLKPGKLTRDYLDGHRAIQIPPFRLFLVVLLAVFFSGSLNFQANHLDFKVDPATSIITKDPSDAAEFQQAMAAMRATPNGRWLVDHVTAAVKNPEAFMTAMEHWSHQFAILMLPIAALMLSVLFVFKKGVYVFDHLIFSMHSLSFQGLLLTAVFLLGLWWKDASALLFLAPVHLFFHMRRAYRISWYGTLARMFALFVLSTVAFAFLMIGLMFVGLAGLH